MAEERRNGDDLDGGDKIGRDKYEIDSIEGGNNAIGPGAQVIRYGDTYILPGEEPPLFVGVPDFPRYGLVGRDDLLDEVIGRLRAGGAAAVSTAGKGGVGKTALAVAAAYHQDLLAHFSDGVLWASIGPGGNALLELGRWAEALHLNKNLYPEPRELKRAVKNAIGRRKLLLVLDDIWDGAQSEMLRCGGPFCAYLLTTRQNSIADEFGGGGQAALSLPDLDAGTAFSLLKTIAGEAVAADEQAARALVEAVGGLPLAVELLGGYLVEGGSPDPNLFPDVSRERLDALGDPALRLGRAKAKLEDSTEKVQLDDLLAFSLEGFSAEERASFYAIGAFAPKPATFSRSAVEAVSGADGRFLSRLVNGNLLEIESGALVIHQVLHDLAQERMAGAAQPRHAAFYLDLINENRGDWQRIDAVYAQIRHAWELLADENRIEWVKALSEHQRLRGYWKEMLVWQERSLAWAREKDQKANVAWLLINLAWTYDHLGRWSEALAMNEQALPIMRDLGDRAGEAAVLNNLARLLGHLGRVLEALEMYKQALPIVRAGDDRAGEAAILNNMASIYGTTGQMKEALALYKRALLIRREEGLRAGEASTLSNMSEIYRRMGQPEKALARLNEALPIMREEGDRAGEVSVLINMAGATEDPLEALARYKELLPIRRELGDSPGEARTLNNMAELNRRMGNPAEALAFFKDALRIRREVGDRAGEALTLWNMALLLSSMNRREKALLTIQEAIQLFEAGLTYDAAGNTLDNYLNLLEKI